MTYHYKVAPFIGRLRSGQPVDGVSRQLRAAISQYVTAGWEFYQLGELTSRLKLGVSQDCSVRRS